MIIYANDRISSYAGSRIIRRNNVMPVIDDRNRSVSAGHRPTCSITNDMMDAGGGGTSAGTVPAATATDDDGGDPDPEPERRRFTKSPSPRAAQRIGTATAADLVLPPIPDDALWRLPTVLQRYPVSRSSWWAGVKSGRYPAPIRISSRCVAWKASAIRDLINSL